VRKSLLVVVAALLSVSLSACSTSGSSSSSPSAVPSKWNEAEAFYLQEIYVSNMAANDVIPEVAYMDMGRTVCQGLTQGTKTVALLALLAATAEQNGLPLSDRKVFGPTVMAAAVTHLCPENITKLVE
jgi:hypothetical protein